LNIQATSNSLRCLFNLVIEHQHAARAQEFRILATEQPVIDAGWTVT